MNTSELSSLRMGQFARVQDLTAEEGMRRRFQDLGLIPGTLVECLYKSPLGDPCAYLIRGAVIGLRQKDAKTIRVQVERHGEEERFLGQVVDNGAF